MYYYIYKTTNTKTGNYYIGKHQSTKKHDSSYFGSGIYIKNSIKKYGDDFFNIFINEVVEYYDSVEELNYNERRIIAEHFDDLNNMNIAEGGAGGNPYFKKPISEETRQKIAIASTGRRHSTETKEKMSKLRTGITFTDETKQKMRNAKIGCALSKEHKSKISKSTSKYRAENKEKTSLASTKAWINRDRNMSDDQKQKIKSTLSPSYLITDNCNNQFVWELGLKEFLRKFIPGTKMNIHKLVNENLGQSIPAPKRRSIGRSFLTGWKFEKIENKSWRV